MSQALSQVAEDVITETVNSKYYIKVGIKRHIHGTLKFAVV